MLVCAAGAALLSQHLVSLRGKGLEHKDEGEEQDDIDSVSQATDNDDTQGEEKGKGMGRTVEEDSNGQDIVYSRE